MNFQYPVEIKNSKTDLPVPVINNVHLHSIYNPEREADGFVTANEQTIEKSSDILVFGLGFGYHLISLEKKLKTIYPKGFRVFCIEPNRNLVDKWRELRPGSLSQNVKVLCYDDIKSFYKNGELVRFLSDKPTILPHPASFQLNESFFKAFMSFHYPTTINESLEFIDDPMLRDYLSLDGNMKQQMSSSKEFKTKVFYKAKNF